MKPHLYSGISPPQTLPGRCGGRLRHRPGRKSPLPGPSDFPRLLFPENHDEIEQKVPKSIACESKPITCGVRPSGASFSAEVTYSVSLVPLPALPAGLLKFPLSRSGLLPAAGARGSP